MFSLGSYREETTRALFAPGLDRYFIVPVDSALNETKNKSGLFSKERLAGFFRRSPKEKKPQFSVAEGELVYAIGDVHGRDDLLAQLIGMMEADAKTRQPYEKCTLVFLGDYVDRGFQSRDVLDRLLTLKPDWADVVCLKGNHEDMMLDFMLDPLHNVSWLQFGGLATLASYGVKMSEAEDGQPDIVKASKELQEKVPDAHFAFLRDAPLTHTSGDYLFVHAGIRPGVPLHAQDPHDLTFIRDEFTESKKSFGVRVVHGHTGVQNPLELPNRIAVDTIAYATGQLTAAVLQGYEVDFLTT